MRIRLSPDRWMRCAGFAAGAVLAVALVTSSRVAATPAGRGLEVRVVANLTGELGLKPFGAFVRAPALTSAPGRDLARGETMVLNQTARPLLLQLRGRPATTELDGDVDVAINVAHHELVIKPLRRFRRWVGGNIVLPPGRAVPLIMRLRVRPGVPQLALAGRLLDFELEFRTEPAPKAVPR